MGSPFLNALFFTGFFTTLIKLQCIRKNFFAYINLMLLESIIVHSRLHDHEHLLTMS